MCDRFRTLHPADWAWISVGVAVLAYEAIAARREWELLSEACDRYRQNHPVLTVGAVGYLAAHLTRLIPKPLDPLHVVAAKVTPK